MGPIIYYLITSGLLLYLTGNDLYQKKLKQQQIITEQKQNNKIEQSKRDNPLHYKYYIYRMRKFSPFKIVMK